MFDDIKTYDRYEEYISNVSEEMKRIYKNLEIKKMLVERKYGDPNNIVLSGWKEDRYLKESIECPICNKGNNVYVDTWKPYYLDWHTCVCLDCFIEFHANKETHMISWTNPLIIKNNLYMTNSDTWQEKYYDEHGLYYLQISG